MKNSFAINIAAVVLLITSRFSVTFGAKCVYYGSPGETGEQTATGEPFNPMGLTCSTLPHLPFGTILQVTNQVNGKSIQVRVNDRLGSSPKEDLIDLTYGAFGLIANHDDGEVSCSYSIVSTQQSTISDVDETSVLNKSQIQTQSQSHLQVQSERHNAIENEIQHENHYERQGEKTEALRSAVFYLRIKDGTVETPTVAASKPTSITATATDDQELDNEIYYGYPATYNLIQRWKNYMPYYYHQSA